MVRRVAAFFSNWAAGINEINQRLTSTELSKEKLSWPALQLTTQHIAIEFDHLIEIVYPQDDVVDQSDIDGIGLIHIVHPILSYTYPPEL